MEQLEERSFAYGKVESMKTQENICQLVIEDIRVTAMTQLSEELESSALISQVMVSTAEKEEEKAGSDKNQMVTADLTHILAGPDRE